MEDDQNYYNWWKSTGDETFSSYKVRTADKQGDLYFTVESYFRQTVPTECFGNSYGGPVVKFVVKSGRNDR